MKEKTFSENKFSIKTKKKLTREMESRDNVEKYGLSVGTRLNKNKNTSKVESQSNIRKLESAKSTVK